jgi:flagellar biosynthesis protein FlhB
MSSENRTLAPSPRKIDRARLAGYVAQSRDLGSAVVLLATCGALAVAGRAIVGGLVVFMHDAFRGASGRFSSAPALDAGSRAIVEALALPLAAAVLSALIINLAQTRGLIRGTVVLPDSTRLVPRLRRLLSADSVLMAGGALLKTAALFTVSATALVVVVPSLLVLCGRPPRLVLEGLFAASKSIGVALTLALLGLGLVDYLWQLARYSRSLRMSMDELKREQRESEGEPLFKHERRRMHLDLTRTFAPLAEADVVVADPHRLAVVIRYSPELAAAPVLVCKGRDAVASRIESLAVAAGVPIVGNPDLATAVDGTEEGDSIPESLYERMAELIADVKLTAKVANRAEQPHTTSDVNDAQ